MDAMTLVTRFGKPDFFITMTCNPYWDEVMAKLLPGQTPQDRPDVIVRAYRAKLIELHDFLIKKGKLGKVAAWAHVTEFQKRGLPHQHFLLVMEPGSKVRTPDDYDKFIPTELPDPEKYPVLHRLVCSHMMHGPCGKMRPDCPCMVNGECRFRYPRQFCQATQQGKDSYPVYRRRDDGQVVTVRGKELDNRWVVPCNPELLMRYNCHINVKICYSIKSCKYLYKYIHKGHDMASFAVRRGNGDGVDINEVKNYRNARMITVLEACYLLFGFPLYSMSPPVLQMQVHMPGMHMVAFNPNEDINDVVRREMSQRSMLTDFFRTNRENPGGHAVCYQEVVPTILAFCECANARALYDKYFDPMVEDYHRDTESRTMVEQMLLRDLFYHLTSMGKEIRDYGLPQLEESVEISSRDYYRELNEELKIGFDEEDLKIVDSLNAGQRMGFDEIMDHVVHARPRVFFVDGPGGTGKTYLYRALLAKVRSEGRIAIATATSGIAASIMHGGQTAHSRFKIPIRLDDNTVCSFTKQSATAELLQRAALVIWDEVAMTKRQAVEALERTLRNIMGSDQPFGGKVMLFGGDFRQVLPVVARGTRARITDATLLRSYIWQGVRRIELTQNMRAQCDTWFADYLLRIGNGTEETFGDDYVHLPEDVVIQWGSEDKHGDKQLGKQWTWTGLEKNELIIHAYFKKSRNWIGVENEHHQLQQSEVTSKKWIMVLLDEGIEFLQGDDPAIAKGYQQVVWASEKAIIGYVLSLMGLNEPEYSNGPPKEGSLLLEGEVIFSMPLIQKGKYGGRMKFRGTELTSTRAEEVSAFNALAFMESNFNVKIIDRNYSDRLKAEEDKFLL
ncbi:hypothetical protein U9M48_018572 [Paspalum notatum var. saurae]|uniref:ATP-dependent DNA helicase n=1 Tax=Paspalum notatum var. saurae TaxID=547442 RepID=A0AAQ3TDE2_PASNO